ncbi:MAG: N-acetyltransferase [Anaerolineae bacterium]|nr:MAG: N-acetyltransferase [Anaerolineae bacterium]
MSSSLLLRWSRTNLKATDPPFTIRAAKLTDQRTIHRIVRAARINPTGLKWQRFWLAVTPQDEVIGCVQLKPHADGSRELASLVVVPAWRGRGVARALIEHLLRVHPPPIYLMCRSSLGVFYTRFGFQPLSSEQMPPYFRRVSQLASLAHLLRQEGETLLIMRWDGVSPVR